MAVNATAGTTNQFSPNLSRNHGVTFDVKAVWLRPGASNLNYVIYNKALPTQSPTWYEQEVDTSFTAGFTLGIGYQFRNMSDIDTHLDWTRLRTNDSASIAADGANYFLGPDYEIGPAGIPIRYATGNAQFDYDVINLVAGKTVHYGDQLSLRFFGGLGGAELNEQVRANYSGTRAGVFAGPFSMQQTVQSQFTGVGPRAGLEVNGSCSSGFGFVGQAGATALIGWMNSKTSFVGGGQELLTTFGQSINQQVITDKTVYQVIPGFDALLGINYQRAFANGAIGKLTVGYQAAVYINAISQYTPASLVDGSPLESGGIFVATMSHTLSNYSVQGPFIEANLSI